MLIYRHDVTVLYKDSFGIVSQVAAAVWTLPIACMFSYLDEQADSKLQVRPIHDMSLSNPYIDPWIILLRYELYAILWKGGAAAPSNISLVFVSYVDGIILC